jgi:bifunctional UDP-N-acetylglucosamine pyrophosphorylase / glucosamine-1-phosphate N-acetyltransferase
MKKNITSEAKKKLRKKRDKLIEKAFNLLNDGVLVHDPKRLDIRGSLSFGNDVEIDVNVIFEGEVVLGNRVFIGANCILNNCTIGDGTRINPFSLIEDSSIGKDSFVGPYGRIRPGTLISNNVQIGNFVELKNVHVGSYSRINHLSFVGDAKLEDNVTIGAGSITCNHNGIEIHQTSIKNGAFIGSGCNLIAPLTINSGSVIGAGSTITEDTPSNSLSLARSKQVVVKKWSKDN